MFKIGIWGFGISGQSYFRFFKRLGYEIQVMDKGLGKYISQTEQNIINFFKNNDYIIASPGIDLNNYLSYKNKLITELDLFYEYWNKKIIAITGSIGKTSTAHLLGKILQNAGLKVAVAGNIGVPMLDILQNQDKYDYAILEISSFQLEHCNKFAPDIAIWTNFFANHLDRHVTKEAYFNAKANIFKYQNVSQISILDFRLKDNLNLISQSHFIDYNQALAVNFPEITFKNNWQIVDKVCQILNITLTDKILSNLDIPEHRLKLIETINGIDFYNDSKSTVIESTLAAVNQLQSKPIILLIGGLSKGVNRGPFIESIKNKVKQIICFGGESEILYQHCLNSLICASKFATLNEAFDFSIKNASVGDQILLSPAGSSYDLFKDYKERGEHFINLIKDYKKCYK